MNERALRRHVWVRSLLALSTCLLVACAGDTTAEPAASTAPTGTEAPPELVWTAALSGSGAIPPGDPDGAGTGTVRHRPGTSTMCVELAVEGIDPVLNVVIHEGAATARGPLVVRFETEVGTATPPTSACGDVDPDQVAGIVDSASMYLELHTRPFPTGALRGELQPRDP